MVTYVQSLPLHEFLHLEACPLSKQIEILPQVGSPHIYTDTMKDSCILLHSLALNFMKKISFSLKKIFHTICTYK